MKRFYAFLVAAFAMTAISCSTDNTIDPAPELDEMGTVEMTFDATIDQTRTTLDYANRLTTWEATDEITVIDDLGGRNTFTIKEGSYTDGKSVIFTGKVTEGATKFAAVYPTSETATLNEDGTVSGIEIPATQICQAGNFPANAATTFAIAENNTLAFKNVCALVKFQVAEAVSSVTFATNGEESVAGTVTAGFDTDSNVVVTPEGTTSSIKLTCEGNFQPETDYFFVSVPNTYANGITVSTDGYVAIEGAVGAKFPRSIISSLSTLPSAAKMAIYLVPGIWASDSPNYSVYYWKGENRNEVMMTKDPDKYGVYMANIHVGADGLLFKRLNPANGSEWNKTGEFTPPTDNKDHYYITGWGATDGEWREYVATQWAVAGTFNSWADQPMERLSASISKATITLTAYNDMFKVKAVGTWDTSYGAGYGYMLPNHYMTPTLGGGDIAVTETGTYDIYFDEVNTLLYVVTTGTDYTSATKQTANGPVPVTGNVYYFKPNSNWTVGGAKFSGYFWNGGGNKWAELTDSDKDGIYECNLGDWTPTNVIFLRKNPSGFTYNNWDNWNRIGNITVPSGKNFYTMASGVWTEQIETGSGYTGGTWGTK